MTWWLVAECAKQAPKSLIAPSLKESKAPKSLNTVRAALFVEAPATCQIVLALADGGLTMALTDGVRSALSADCFKSTGKPNRSG